MILITGDLHGTGDLQRFNYIPDGLTKDDYIIVTGDFGLVWDNSDKENFWLDRLNESSWTTLFIDGNHENFDLLDKFELKNWNGGKVHFVRDSVIHLMCGQVFKIDDKLFFTFGGAESPYFWPRIRGVTWWKQEIPAQEEYAEGLKNLANNNNKVDFILSHTCSYRTLKEISQYIIGFRMYESEINLYFEKLEDLVDYKHWYFGHFHCYDMLDDKHTVLYHNLIQIL